MLITRQKISGKVQIILKKHVYVIFIATMNKYDISIALNAFVNIMQLKSQCKTLDAFILFFPSFPIRILGMFASGFFCICDWW